MTPVWSKHHPRRSVLKRLEFLAIFGRDAMQHRISIVKSRQNQRTDEFVAAVYGDIPTDPVDITQVIVDRKFYI